MAAVSCVASLHQIRTGEKVILSPQDVINHVPGDENGYYIPNIYRFIKVAGVGLEVDIPYGAPRSPTQIGHRVYIHGQRVVKGAKDILEVLERHPVVCIVSGEESLSILVIDLLVSLLLPLIHLLVLLLLPLIHLLALLLPPLIHIVYSASFARYPSVYTLRSKLAEYTICC
ncbi:hypothetical protein PS2_024340 [Malus domestica]